MTQQSIPVEAVEYVDIDVEVGIRVQSLMFRARHKQANLAAILGIAQTGVSRKLRGLAGWSATDLMKIARAYNVDPGELLPELDSNQQPSGYLSREINDDRRDLSAWDASLDFYAGGWIAAEHDASWRWRAWMCPGAGGVLDAWVTTPHGRTWARWVDLMPPAGNLSGSAQA